MHDNVTQRDCLHACLTIQREDQVKLVQTAVSLGTHRKDTPQLCQQILLVIYAWKLNQISVLKLL